MKMYLMRHGSSPGMLEAGVKRDFDRPLSERGRKYAHKTAVYLNDAKVSPGLILVSPLVRARQTAEEVVGVLDPKLEFRAYDPLSNKIDGVKLLAQLDEDGLRDRELLLIGHLPQLPELMNHLTGRDIGMRPADICAFETNGSSARLLWSFSPSDD